MGVDRQTFHYGGTISNQDSTSTRARHHSISQKQSKPILTQSKYSNQVSNYHSDVPKTFLKPSTKTHLVLGANSELNKNQYSQKIHYQDSRLEKSALKAE